MTEKKRGRPPGTFQWGEKKKPKTHKFTPRAHKWIVKNRVQIEVAALLNNDLKTGGTSSE